MRILVADDEAGTRRVIRRVLESEGFEVLEAGDGLEALDRFQSSGPDIVVTDYSMPNLNGVDLCRALSTSSPGRFLPIIMLTGGDDPDLLVRSLEAGALEFLSKPIRPTELRSRINAIAALARSHKALAESQAEVEQEVRIVKHLLERVTRPGLRTLPPHFAMETIQTQRINGDACAYHETLAGVHFGLLCDATGHGLVAGVSTLPVVEAFNAMSARDTPLESIYREVNRKLARLLPTGRFACLVLLRLDSRSGLLQVLNAGMPDVLFFHAADHGFRRFASRNLPAGVLEPGEAARVEECLVSPGDRVFACSDGLIDLFTEEQVIASFLRRGAGHPVAEDHTLLRALIDETLENAEQHDDLTWAMWQIPPAKQLGEMSPVEAGAGADGRLGLSLRFAVDPRHLGLRDLVPNLLGLLGYQGVPVAIQQQLGILLSEALSNAVDHGLLGIPSALKEQDFEAFDQARREALGRFQEGEAVCSLGLWYDAREPQRLDRIEVEVGDSGLGFDWRPWIEEGPADLVLPHGRGIRLLRSLATNLRFNPEGNRVAFIVRV